MATRFQRLSRDIKAGIKEDYLQGMAINDIAQKYGFKDRWGIYYYLKPLTVEEKMQHLRNSLIRRGITNSK